MLSILSPIVRGPSSLLPAGALRAAREEAKAHRSKMADGPTASNQSSAGRRPAATVSTSRAGMERRFDDMKKKRDDAEKDRSEPLKTSCAVY